MNYDELVEQVNLFLDEEEAAGRFSGTVLVAHQTQPILTAARGYAIQPAILPNQPDTKFNIASITKMLTATAVIKLVAAGQIDLHKLVSDYDPALPHADKITAHQLLTHTAGFGYYWNDAYRATRSDLRTIADYLKLFAADPLEFTPGSRHRYCNTGYVVLGALIEAVTGQSYYEHLRQSIFELAGMHDTGHFELDLPMANRAVGYTTQHWFGPKDGQMRSNDYIYAVKGSPSEHCYSTVQDLYNFFLAFQNHLFFAKDYVEQCITPQAESENPGVRYGYGFHLIETDQHGRSFGHGGRALGGDTFAMNYIDLGYIIIVLSNYDRPAARRVLNSVADLLIK